MSVCEREKSGVEGSGCKVGGISQQSAGSISVINYEESQQVLMHKSNDGEGRGSF